MTTHKRWTQTSKTFPSDKYSFSFHLQRIGDWIQTGPLSVSEVKKIVDAAYIWAWHKKWRVQTKRIRVSEDKYEVKITLTSKEYKREFT